MELAGHLALLVSQPGQVRKQAATTNKASAEIMARLINFMTKKVLARKYRPKNFDQLMGQSFVVQALNNSLNNNRLHHAYLFSGTRGVGKTTIARILAKCLNCEKSPGPNPCCSCNTCNEIDEGKALDVIELDAASNTQVDNMRELMENAQYQPSSAKYKIFIIDEVHMLSKSSFNAMLKTLEEPPEHVKFILATTDPEKIPVTVLSRCLHFSLLNMTSEDIETHLANLLTSEDIAFEQEALKIIAKSAKGSMRDALTITDQVINYSNGNVTQHYASDILNVSNLDFIYELIDAISKEQKDKVYKLLERIKLENHLLSNLLSDMAEILQIISNCQTFNISENQKIEAISKELKPETTQLLYQIAINGIKDLPFAPNVFIGTSMTIIRMVNFVPSTQLNTTENSQEKKIANKADDIVAEKKTENTATKDSISPVDDSSWRAMVDKLPQGIAKNLAQNSELTNFNEEDGVVSLALDTNYKHLNNQNYIRMLEESLSALFNKKINIKILVADSTDTPAIQIKQEKADKLTNATDSIKNDDYVKNLIDEFNGQIIEESIKSK